MGGALLLLLMASLGLLMVVLSIPLVMGKVRRNPWYGFRTPKTLASDGVWYAANRYAGRALAAAGTVTFIGCIAAIPLAWLLPMAAIHWIALLLTLGPLLVAVIGCFLYLRTL